MEMRMHRLKQVAVMAIDACIVIMSEYIALAMRFDITNIPEEYLLNMQSYLLADIVITLGVFLITGLYNRILSLMSFGDLVKLMEAVAASGAIVCFYKFLIVANMPRSFYILYIIFLFLLETGFRLGIRLYFYYRNTVRKLGRNVRTMTEAYETNKMSTLGKNIDEVERFAYEFTGSRYAVALASGASAFHMAVKLAGVRSGEKVFCSDMEYLVINFLWRIYHMYKIDTERSLVIHLETNQNGVGVHGRHPREESLWNRIL